MSPQRLGKLERLIPMPPPILIVGAGPAGLVTALALLRNGIPVRIIDKRPTYAVGQRGANVMPRVIEAHQILGSLPDFLNRAEKVPLMRTYELPGGTKPICTMDTVLNTEPSSAIPYPVPLFVPQDVHEDILRVHLEKLSCLVELGTELRMLRQTSHRVTVALARQKDGKEEIETAHFDYVVGADGGHSTVRKLLTLEFPGETRESEHMVIGDIEIKAGIDEEFWHRWGSPADRMATLRSSRKGDKFFFIVLAGLKLDRARTSSSREELIKEFYDITGRTDIRFGELSQLAQYRPNIRMVSKFRHGRVIMAGDAAHCHSATGSQGMNSSFLDGFNLGWKLALVHKGHSPPTLLDSYDAERLPVISEMLEKTTAILNVTFQPKDSSGREYHRGQELYLLCVNYRKSPIVIDDESLDTETFSAYNLESETAARAGDRAPDAPNLCDVRNPSKTTSLFRLFFPDRHVIISFNYKNQNDRRAVLGACSQLPPLTIHTCLVVPKGHEIDPGVESWDYVLRDDHGFAFENYHVDETSSKIFVIRPDGVVGAVVGGVEGLNEYFSKIFMPRYSWLNRFRNMFRIFSSPCKLA